MKISIITVCFNSEKTIEETLESVSKQDYDNYEHIIIDGGSTDKTLKIVEKYRCINKMKIVSEPDEGLYDAMNKGVRLASGDIIGILNSDDVYANKRVLSIIADTFMRNKCDAIYSDLLFKDQNMEKIERVWKAGKGSIHTGWHPPHPTLYIKSDVFRRTGEFKLKYSIAADFDFMVRLMKMPDLKICYIPQCLIFMRIGGASTGGLKNYLRSLKQSGDSLKENGEGPVIVINGCRIVRVLLQFAKGKMVRKNINNLR